eukprot:3781-Heterococcus_DN1.PRE.1
MKVLECRQAMTALVNKFVTNQQQCLVFAYTWIVSTVIYISNCFEQQLVHSIVHVHIIMLVLHAIAAYLCAYQIYDSY